MRLFVRVSLIGLVGLVALGYWVGQTQQNTSPAVQVTSGVCEAEGISLVIDFGTESSTPAITKCVQNYAGNSWDLFNAAGITVTGTQKYPVGFVCRINNFPAEKDEPCIETPGATNGSWAFYLTEEGSWKYSTYGASSHKTKCGQSEGWRFLLPNEEVSSAPRVKPVTANCEK